MTQPRRRVWFLNRFFSPDLSATSVLLSDLTAALAGDTLDVHVICGGRGYKTNQHADTASTVNGVCRHVTPANIPGQSRVGAYLEYILGARRILAAQLQPGDTVVAMTDPPMLGASVAPLVRKRGAHLIHWWQDVFPDILAQSFPSLGWCVPIQGAGRRWQSARLGDARHVAISNDMAERLLGWLGGVDTTVVENWMPGTRADPVHASGDAVRQQLNVQGRTLLMYAGNLGRVHDTPAVLEACRAVADSDHLSLAMIGGGAGAARLRKMAARECWPHVSFHGYVDGAELDQWLRAADLHLVSLLPQMEGLSYPSKLYPILAAGRPVLYLGAAHSDIAHRLEQSRAGWTTSEPRGWLQTLDRAQHRAEQLEMAGTQSRRLHEQLDARAAAIRAWAALLSAPHPSRAC